MAFWLISPVLPAKPSAAGSPGRGGARERAQFSPSGGNGDKRTQGELARRAKRKWPGPLRRRAAMGKVTRRRLRPQARFGAQPPAGRLLARRWRRNPLRIPGKEWTEAAGQAPALQSSSNDACFSDCSLIRPSVRTGVPSPQGEGLKRSSGEISPISRDPAGGPVCRPSRGKERCPPPVEKKEFLQFNPSCAIMHLTAGCGHQQKGSSQTG